MADTPFDDMTLIEEIDHYVTVQGLLPGTARWLAESRRAGIPLDDTTTESGNERLEGEPVDG